MAHNDYARPDGQWPNELVLMPGDVRSWDIAQSSALNAVSDGTYAPATPIVLGGAGLNVYNQASFSGGVTTQSGGRLVLAASVLPTVATGVVRTLLCPLWQSYLQDDGNLQSLAPSLSPRGLTALTQLEYIYNLPIPKRYIHHNSTLTNVALSFYVGQQHAQIPVNLPQFNIKRVSAANSYATLLIGPATLATPATSDAYYAGGAVQTITGTCNQNNVIDTSSNAYFLVINDENGTGALPGNTYASLALTYTGSTTLAPE